MKKRKKRKKKMRSEISLYPFFCFSWRQGLFPACQIHAYLACLKNSVNTLLRKYTNAPAPRFEEDEEEEDDNFFFCFFPLSLLFFTE